jgi:hypothetical protein
MGYLMKMKSFKMLYYSVNDDKVKVYEVKSSSIKQLEQDFRDFLSTVPKQGEFKFKDHMLDTEDFFSSVISSYVLPPLFLTVESFLKFDLEEDLVFYLLKNQKTQLSKLQELFPLSQNGKKFLELEEELSQVEAEMFDLKINKQENSEPYKIASNRLSFILLKMESLKKQGLFF